MGEVRELTEEELKELSDGRGADPKVGRFYGWLAKSRGAVTTPTYTNSKLVDYVKRSPNHSGLRTHKIDRITIHHMAGVLSVEQCGSIFASAARQASSNYGIDSNGRVGLYVDEKNRSWASSSWDNDQRAVTIEVSNSATGGQWPVSDKALSKLIDLCVDICKRNNIRKLNYTGSTTGNLTLHCWFAATACPGPYLKSKMKYIATQVNKRLVWASKYTLKNMVYPTKVKKGTAFVCKGTIGSVNYMRRVEIGIVDKTGKKWTSRKMDLSIGDWSFDIGNKVGLRLHFNTLPKGTYYYRCWCWDDNGAKKVFDKKFTVI